jgi:WD40 repeat protein
VPVQDRQVGTTLRTVAGHTAGAISGAGFSPDRRYVVSGGNEALLRVWNRTNAQQIRVFSGSAGGTGVARFSLDGARILTTFGTTNLSAQLLNADTGALEREFPGLSVAVFSPDGLRIATGDPEGTARLWDVATGTQIRLFNSPGSSVSWVAISSNGMVLASGASDGIVRLWNTSNGQLLRKGLLNAYLMLKPWPDAADALRKLKASGVRIITMRISAGKCCAQMPKAQE